MKRDDRQLRFQKGLLLCLATFSLLFLMAIEVKAADSAANYPSQPIEHVVSVVGGNPEMLGRVIGDVLQKEKIFSQPFTIVHKSGSGGINAMAYALEKRGNPYVTWGAGSSNVVSMPLTRNLPYKYTDFTYLANMCVDASVLVVRSDSPFKTIDDLIAESKKRPKSVVAAGGSPIGSANLNGLSIQKAKGVEWKFLSLVGHDNDAMLSVLSGDSHLTISNPPAVFDYVQTGKLRVLLACSPIRYLEFKDAPTSQEAGLGEPVVVHRGIAGPPDMPDYAVKKLVAAFKKVYESAQFKKYLKDTAQQPFWLSGKDYDKELASVNDRYKVFLGELKLLKK